MTSSSCPDAPPPPSALLNRLRGLYNVPQHRHLYTQYTCVHFIGCKRYSAYRCNDFLLIYIYASIFLYFSDIDECENPRNPCGRGSTCVNTGGGFECFRAVCPNNRYFVKRSSRYRIHIPFPQYTKWMHENSK